MTASTNVDLVRSILAAWERGDYSSAEWAQPDIEFVLADGPEAERWTGLAGLADWSRYHLSAWEDAHVQVQERRELDGEHVLALVRYFGRGKRSGVDLGQMQPEGT